MMGNEKTPTTTKNNKTENYCIYSHLFCVFSCANILFSRHRLLSIQIESLVVCCYCWLFPSQYRCAFLGLINFLGKKFFHNVYAYDKIDIRFFFRYFSSFLFLTPFRSFFGFWRIHLWFTFALYTHTKQIRLFLIFLFKFRKLFPFESDSSVGAGWRALSREILFRNRPTSITKRWIEDWKNAKKMRRPGENQYIAAVTNWW